MAAVAAAEQGPSAHELRFLSDSSAGAEPKVLVYYAASELVVVRKLAADQDGFYFQGRASDRSGVYHRHPGGSTRCRTRHGARRL